jgi:hypothetical protein
VTGSVVRRAAYRAAEGVPVAVAAALPVLVLSLALDRFSPLAAVLGGLAGIGAGAAWVAHAVRRDRADRRPVPGRLVSWGPWGLVAGAGAWLWATHAEWVDINRDPGFLVTSARLLQQGQGVPLRLAPDPLLSVVPDAVTVVGPALYAGPDPGSAYMQGAPGLPLLLASLGWVTDPGTFPVHAGPVLAAASLLGVVVLSRALLGPRLWSLLPAAALAVSLPWLYAARATFTEPVTLLLSLAGLALVAAGVVGRDRAALLTGAAVAGSASLVRVDGVLVAAVPVVLLIGVALLTGRLPARFARTSLVAVGVALGLAATGLGVLVWASAEYTASLTTELALGWVAAAASVAALVLGLAVARRPDGSALRSWSRTWVPRLLPAVALAGLVLLGSRIWWYTAYGIPAGSPYEEALARLQQAEGLPIDGTRTYDEATVASVAWYFGIGALLLAGLALAALAARVPRRAPRAVGALAVAVALLVQEVVYLRAWSITPDQIWASRRLVVGAYPVLLVLAAAGAALLVRWTRRALPDRPRAARGASGAVAAAGVAVLVVPALVTSWPFLTTGDHAGMLGVLERTCTTARAAAARDFGDPGLPAVVLVATPQERLMTPLAAECGITTVRVAPGAEPEAVVAWATAARAAGWAPIAMLGTDVADRAADVSEAVPVYPQRISGPPREIGTLRWELAFLPVDADTADLLEVDPRPPSPVARD